MKIGKMIHGNIYSNTKSRFILQAKKERRNEEPVDQTVERREATEFIRGGCGGRRSHQREAMVIGWWKLIAVNAIMVNLQF